MKKVILMAIAFTVSFLFAVPRTFEPEKYDIGEDLEKNEESWIQSSVDFVQEHKNTGFRYADNKRRIAVCAVPGAVYFHKIPVYETRCYFQMSPKKMVKAELSLYNKGDAKLSDIMTKEQLTELVDNVMTILTPEGEAKPKAKSRKLQTGRGMTYTCVWPKRKPSASLMWGISGDRGNEKVEFVRLTLSQGNAKESASTASEPAKKGSIISNIKKNDEGDVWIANIPMVDQGQKGYCAVATAERVLRYYGNDIDEHQIAQMAGSSAEGGTSVAEMIKSVEIIGKKCKLGLAKVAQSTVSLGDLEKRINIYNQVASKMGKEKLDFNKYVSRKGSWIYYEPGKALADMEPKVLKAIAMKNGSGYKRFSTGIRQQIKAGIPLFWGVTLGIYSEPEIPQAAGGHMRLIIGYNDETGDILYSDSWGAGHEIKRMPEDWAWTITHDVFYLKPRK
jgi:hypothetical protein